MSDQIECVHCKGTGFIKTPNYDQEITYGKNKIGKDWERIENVYIWFAALRKFSSWRGLKGYVYKKPDGSFVAPFRGSLVNVLQDTKDEYKEVE